MEHVTRDNVLDVLETAGREVAMKASPNYWSHEDRGRAKNYEPALAACRAAWKAVKLGADILPVLTTLNKQRDVPLVRLLIDAVKGKLAKSEAWFRTPPAGGGYHWVTFGGDFYGVCFGDKLNLPRVNRQGNGVPDDRKKLDGAEAVAALMPNPCTRVNLPVQFS